MLFVEAGVFKRQPPIASSKHLPILCMQNAYILDTLPFEFSNQIIGDLFHCPSAFAQSSCAWIENVVVIFRTIRTWIFQEMKVHKQ
jgi:hypothetical protein